MTDHQLKPRASRGAAEYAVFMEHGVELSIWIQQQTADDRSYRYIARAIGDLTGGPQPAVQTVCNWGQGS